MVFVPMLILQLHRFGENVGTFWLSSFYSGIRSLCACSASLAIFKFILQFFQAPFSSWSEAAMAIVCCLHPVS
jgi:hypothetical protein